MGNNYVFSSGSVRDRYQANNNSGPDHAPMTDHSVSQWGTLSVTQRIENQRQVSYMTSCSCGARGQRVSQQELASGVVPVCRFCNGTGVAPGDARRTAGVAEQHMRQDIVLSPRQRAEEAASRAEREAFEKNGGAQ
jgi:hypothetical protein